MPVVLIWAQKRDENHSTQRIKKKQDMHIDNTDIKIKIVLFRPPMTKRPQKINELQDEQYVK